MCYEYSPFPQRIRPDKGVLIKDYQPTLVFVTICTKGYKPWLATDTNHCLLRTIWTETTYWKVGNYVVTPNIYIYSRGLGGFTPTLITGYNIGNLFLQSACASRIADGNGLRFIIASAPTKALTNAMPI